MTLPLGFFAPMMMPAIMPLLAEQSAGIGGAFSANSTYWKRKISSMSNEDFNRLSPDELNRMVVDSQINNIAIYSSAVNPSAQLNNVVIQEIVNIVKLALQKGVAELVSGGLSSSVTGGAGEGFSELMKKLGLGDFKGLLPSADASSDMFGIDNSDMWKQVQDLLNTKQKTPDSLALQLQETDLKYQQDLAYKKQQEELRQRQQTMPVHTPPKANPQEVINALQQAVNTAYEELHAVLSMPNSSTKQGLLPKAQEKFNMHQKRLIDFLETLK